MSDSGWPQGNPLAPAQAVAFMTAVGREVVPDDPDFVEGGDLLDDAAAEAPFEAVLTTCVIATTAARMVRELDPQRDWDLEAVLASDLPEAQRRSGMVPDLLHVI